MVITVLFRTLIIPAWSQKGPVQCCESIYWNLKEYLDIRKCSGLLFHNPFLALCPLCCHETCTMLPAVVHMEPKKWDFAGFNIETGAETGLLETGAGINISLLYILASFSVCKITNGVTFECWPISSHVHLSAPVILFPSTSEGRWQAEVVGLEAVHSGRQALTLNSSPSEAPSLPRNIEKHIVRNQSN